MSDLATLFAKRAEGFVPGLLDVLPRPWDAPPEKSDLATEKNVAPYLISEELAAAAWVALLLRQPLLLTGDPGVGKSRFAEKLAADLGLKEPLVVLVKSTMSGRDLLYTFDELARFRDATTSASEDLTGLRAAATRDSAVAATLSAKTERKPLISYVRLQGLGRAIVRAAGGAAPITFEPGVNPVDVVGKDLGARAVLTLVDLFPGEFADGQPASPANLAPRHSVVLIDEFDKAPRDTPNDLLAEIEAMKFRFDELGFSLAAQAKFKPIVIITSNVERNLPDAFLRRCVFHFIQTPGEDTMRKIAAARLLGDVPVDCTLMKSASQLFTSVKNSLSEKKPGTAEFIALVAYLRQTGLRPDQAVPDDASFTNAAVSVIAKTTADLTSAAGAVARRI